MGDMANRSRGRWGEDRAAAHYRSLGFDIVNRNWRSGLHEVPGELDLVAATSRPVRVLRGQGPQASRLRRTPRTPSTLPSRRGSDHSPKPGCGANQPGDVDVRFDVIAVEGVTLTHHESAF